MFTGERLATARKAKGMTQLELGLEMHYPYRSAIVRIAQYETGLKRPSAETLDALADAMQISRKALTGPEGYEVDDVMQFLFELEEHGYHVEVRRRDREIVAEISGGNLDDSLKEWRRIKKRFKKDVITENQYLMWKLCWTLKVNVETA